MEDLGDGDDDDNDDDEDTLQRGTKRRIDTRDVSVEVSMFFVNSEIFHELCRHTRLAV